MEALEQVKARFARVIPIVSECTAATDTRFGCAHELMREMARICDHRVISTVKAAEPIGPQKLLDLLIICPCTGNTLGKLANGVTDTSVTMAAKAHLRNSRPLVIAPSTNDGLAASAVSIGALLPRKYIYFVPFGQDDPERKPTSLVSDFSLVADAPRPPWRENSFNPCSSHIIDQKRSRTTPLQVRSGIRSLKGSSRANMTGNNGAGQSQIGTE